MVKNMAIDHFLCWDPGWWHRLLLDAVGIAKPLPLLTFYFALSLFYSIPAFSSFFPFLPSWMFVEEVDTFGAYTRKDQRQDRNKAGSRTKKQGGAVCKQAAAR